MAWANDFGYSDESGDLLGVHHWDQEVLKETRGEFIFTHVCLHDHVDATPADLSMSA